MSAHLSMTKRFSADRIEIEVAGELDLASGPELLEMVLESMSNGDLVLDLQQVRFIDVAGLRALIAIDDESLKRQCRTVFDLPEAIHALLAFCVRQMPAGAARQRFHRFLTDTECE